MVDVTVNAADILYSKDDGWQYYACIEKVYLPYA